MSTVDETAVDAVFVIGTGSKNNNEELKYALRNLEKNCPFVRNVYISGECPSWVDTSVVKHLKWPDRFTHAKDANIIDKLRHACEQPGIAKRILFCSDDQFQTRECTWDDFAPRWLRKYTESDTWYEDRKRIWHTRLHNTLERDRQRRVAASLDSAEVYYYQPHIWMQIDRDKFIEYSKWSDYEHRDDTIIASGYFNYINAGGKSNYDHIFISANQAWPVKETHIAYSDPSFLAAMSYLKKTFNSASKYEISSDKKKVDGSTDNKEKNIDNVKKENIKKEKDQHTESERTDDVIIADIKRKIIGEPAWGSLALEIEEAENLRQDNFIGWKKVWNDIIRRWADATEKGKLRIPVLSTRSDEATAIIDNYRKKNPKKIVTAPEEIEDIPNKSEHVDAETSSPKKKCTKCEEKRRKAKEAQEKKEREELEKLKEIQNTNDKIENVVYDELDGDSDACIDCAIEHLSIAAAYLNSNAARPSALDVELAKGEVIVASNHLLALNRNEEYNMCVEALTSVYSENSLFSASTLRDILRRALDVKSNP